MTTALYVKPGAAGIIFGFVLVGILLALLRLWWLWWTLGECVGCGEPPRNCKCRRTR